MVTRSACGLLVLLLLAGCASVTPSVTRSPSFRASPLASSPASGTSTAAPSLAQLPSDLAHGAWWRLSWTDGGVALPDHEHLRIGLLDGTVTARLPTSDLWHEATNVPIVRGPVAGLVLFGRWSAVAIDLHLVSAETGVDRVIASVPSSTQDVELAPGAGAVFWIDTSTDDGGVWRLDLASGIRTRLLPRVEVTAAHAGTVLAAIAAPHAQLALSTDGRRLAAIWCGLERCSLQVLTLEGTKVSGMTLTETWHDLLGFAGADVALNGACADLAAQTVRDVCERPDARAKAADWSLNLEFGAELPAGWTLDVIHDPDAKPMEFALQAVAIPDKGGQSILLTAPGLLFGQ